MTSDNDRCSPLDVTEDDLNRGFDAVMDRLQQQSPQQRAELQLRAQRAELAFVAYALGLERLKGEQHDEARHWLEIAAHYGVPDAQHALDDLELRQVVHGAAPAACPDTEPPAKSAHKTPIQARPVGESEAAAQAAARSSYAEAQRIAAAARQQDQVAAAARCEAEVLLESARQKAQQVVADARREANALLTRAQGMVEAQLSSRLEFNGMAAGGGQVSYAHGQSRRRFLSAVSNDTAALSTTSRESSTIASEPDRSSPVRRILAHPRGGPTVLRIVLGSQLRRLREARGITREVAGETIRASQVKISRLEFGRTSYKEPDVADLLTLYGVVEEQERESFLTLARRANSPGWWHQYSDVLPSWFDTYISLEQAASIIRCYEVQFVPGLLQTPDYARAVTLLGHPQATPREIDRWVDLRMRRQELLHPEEGPRLWAVIDEAALRRPLGGRKVMKAQLEYLIEASKQPNITLQIAPFRMSGLARAGGSMTILGFPERDLPDIVYLEQLTSALYLDRRYDVDNYLAVMDRLSVESEPRANTAGFLNQLINELDEPGDH